MASGHGKAPHQKAGRAAPTGRASPPKSSCQQGSRHMARSRHAASKLDVSFDPQRDLGDDKTLPGEALSDLKGSRVRAFSQSSTRLEGEAPKTQILQPLVARLGSGFHWHVVALGGASIKLAGAANALQGVVDHLLPLCNPTRCTSNGVHDCEHVRWKA